MSIEGMWNTASKTPLGQMQGKLELRCDGNTLSGSCTSKWNTDPIIEGKVNGDEFEFTINTKTPMGTMKVVYKGKIEGNTMSGITTTKPLGIKTPFTAIKA